jgi:hypothetical protein
MKGDVTTQRRWEAYDKLGTFVVYVMTFVLGVQAIGLEGEAVLGVMTFVLGVMTFVLGVQAIGLEGEAVRAKQSAKMQQRYTSPL